VVVVVVLAKVKVAAAAAAAAAAAMHCMVVLRYRRVLLRCGAVRCVAYRRSGSSRVDVYPSAVRQLSVCVVVVGRDVERTLVHSLTMYTVYEKKKTAREVNIPLGILIVSQKRRIGLNDGVASTNTNALSSTCVFVDVRSPSTWWLLPDDMVISVHPLGADFCNKSE